MSYKSSLCKDAHRFYMGPGRPGKSWNFLFTLSWTESLGKRIELLESFGNLFNSNNNVFRIYL